MSGFFKRTVVDCGNVRQGDAVKGFFECLEGFVVKKADGGCTCGGRPMVNFEISGAKLSFVTESKMVNGNRNVERPITVTMGNGARQVLYIKYNVI